MAEMTLAEALLKRKELQTRLQRLEPLKRQDVLQIMVKRKPVADNLDDILAEVPRLSIEQVTHAFDWLSKRLRLIDAVIQQANWNTKLDVDPQVLEDYVDPLPSKQPSMSISVEAMKERR